MEELLFGSIRMKIPDAQFRVSTDSMVLADFCRIKHGSRVLDLGCGCGVVGVAAAKTAGEENVFMSDVDPVAVEVSRRNAVRNGVGNISICLSDGFQSVDATGFDIILSNPPYQTDFSVAKGFIEKGFNRLKIGGRLYMVTKRCEWYKNKIRAIFGGVEVRPTDGYYVFIAERRSLRYANRSVR